MMSNKDQAILQNMEALLDAKKGLLSRILELTQQQPALIADEDTDKLLSNISGRQDLIDMIDKIDGQVSSLPDDGKDHSAVRAEMQKLLKEIAKQDAENEKAAAARIEDLRSNIAKLSQGRKSKNLYDNRPGGVGAVYFDQHK